MGLMKVAVMIAIALALSGVGALAIQTVAVQLDEGPGASSFAPGQQHNTIQNPGDPYRFAPGQTFKGVPPNPVLPGASQLSPGILSQSFDIGHGGG